MDTSDNDIFCQFMTAKPSSSCSTDIDSTPSQSPESSLAEVTKGHYRHYYLISHLYQVIRCVDYFRGSNFAEVPITRETIGSYVFFESENEWRFVNRKWDPFFSSTELFFAGHEGTEPKILYHTHRSHTPCTFHKVLHREPVREQWGKLVFSLETLIRNRKNLKKSATETLESDTVPKKIRANHYNNILALP